MSEWKKTRLGDLYALPSRNGLTRPSAVRGSGYKMAAMGEIFADDFIGASDMERVQLNERELNTMLLEEDDLLFARQSLILSGAGKCAIVRGLTEPTTFESHLIRVRLNKALANSLFYMYYFHSSCSPIKSIVQQGVQAGIRGSDLEGLLVDYPPRPIQDRIAGILSDYDSAIANCRKQIALLEEAAMRLYREWFKDGKGEKKKLCDVCDILYGKPHKDIPYGNIPIYGSAGIMRYGNKAKFAEESVLIPRKGTLDNVMYVDDPFWVVDTMFYTRFKISHMAKIAFYQLAKLKMSNMNTGTAVPSMTTETLYKLDLIVPPEELRKRFDELVSKLFSAKKRCLLQIRTLTEARDRLLPKLMKGEIAV